MNLQYAPRHLVIERIRQGWRLIPGHSYDPGDWAILMIVPRVASEASDEDLVNAVLTFRLVRIDPVGTSNRSKAGMRSWKAYAKARAALKREMEAV